jgi:hypothetical protein
MEDSMSKKNHGKNDRVNGEALDMLGPEVDVEKLRQKILDECKRIAKGETYSCYTMVEDTKKLIQEEAK